MFATRTEGVSWDDGELRPTHCPVLTQRTALQPGYAKPGTDRAYGAANWYWRRVPCSRLPAVMSHIYAIEPRA
eukprot:3853559-Rhodomonas_salina.4